MYRELPSTQIHQPVSRTVWDDLASMSIRQRSAFGKNSCFNKIGSVVKLLFSSRHWQTFNGCHLMLLCRNIEAELSMDQGYERDMPWETDKL